MQVKNFANVTALAAGGGHTLALKQDGTVWAWGDNSTNQLGGAVTEASYSTPIQVKNLTNVTALAAGGDYSLALKQDGTVQAWGGNTYSLCGRI